MPLRKFLPAAGLLLTLVPAATTSVAQAATVDGCKPLPTTKAFKGVDGDRSDYTVAPGGGFEPGGAAWSLTGAARVELGNETLGVRPGIRALRLPLGSTATSPEFCVDQTKPTFRFAYKVDNASLSGFLALVIYRDRSGQVSNVEITSSKRVAPHPTFWQASDGSPLSTLLPLGDAAPVATVQLKFVSLVPADFVDQLATRFLGDNPATSALLKAQAAYQQAAAAAWSPFVNVGVSIDSVMVDPYRRG